MQTSVTDLPVWRRTAYRELSTWTFDPPADRAVVLSGAPQIGKTTVMLQMIQELLDSGVPAANILYVFTG